MGYKMGAILCGFLRLGAAYCNISHFPNLLIESDLHSLSLRKQGSSSYEQRIENPRVGGSIPSLGTNIPEKFPQY